MKLFVVALLGVFTATAFVVKTEKEILGDILSREIPVEAERLTGQALADYVNSQQQFFKAEVPEMSVERRKARLMDVKYVEQKADFIAPEIDTISNDDIPSNFDARQKWSNCPSINNIRDQSDCGSCWAFAATEAMSDRVCIASQGQVQVSLSAEDMLSCCGLSCGDGCKGGFNIRAWKHWVNVGICTGGSYASHAGCKPYAIAPCGHHVNETFYGDCPKKTERTPKCTKECVSGYPKAYNDDKYYGQSAYGVEQSVAAIQKEIMTNGPVEAAFMVYSDFDQYTGGIYVHTAGKREGGHAVKILGWGTENGTPYWLVANSWNTDWGENGFFRIIRGVNECGIEEAIVAGLPK